MSSAAAVIIIINGVQAKLDAILATDLANMRPDKIADIQAFLTSGQACVDLAATEAGVS